MIQAAAVLVGRGASQSSRGRRERRRGSQGPLYHPPPGRAPSVLRPWQQQAFRRMQRQSRPSRRNLRVAPPAPPASSSTQSPRASPVSARPPPQMPVQLSLPRVPNPPLVADPLPAGAPPDQRRRARPGRCKGPRHEAPRQSLLTPLPPPAPEPFPPPTPAEDSSQIPPPRPATFPWESLLPAGCSASHPRTPQHRWSRRLALAALQAPQDIVPAAASVLRWMDGRLCWILAE
ncbi:unnamed protein product [Closterium sp. NIES-65]|nr:unnamed protein product [Closterium sp. NIES-65]